MRGVHVLAGVVLSLAASAQHANAAAPKVFDWSLASPNLGAYDTSPVVGSGTITATEASGGAWTVDAVTGSFTDLVLYGTPTFAVTGVGPVAENVLQVTNDNEIYPSGKMFLDTSGLSFETTDGPIDIFWSTSENNYEVTSSLGIGTGTFTLTTVPLPATLPMFGGGLVAIGFLSLRKKRKAQSELAAN